MVEAYVTPELLRQIAIEHARGRRLLIVTTNLDAQESVIWDMGVLASQGGDQAVELFREVLLASASIPGVFPPVMIPGVDDQGRLVEEMHVDGGVNTPFLGIPESLLTVTTPTRAPEGTALYVLINGQIGRTQVITRGTLPAILARAYDTMSKANLRTSLAVNLAFAERNGLGLYVAAIPDGVEASSLDFDPESMAALFERGRAAAAAGAAWTKLEGPLPGQGISAKARTGKVPKAFSFGGAAVNRKPSSGSSSRPRICSQIGMPAPSNRVWAGRDRVRVSSMLWESMPTSAAPASTRKAAAASVRNG